MDLDELSLWPAKLGMLSLSSRSASPGMLSSTSTATTVSGVFCSSMQPFGFLNFIGNDLRNCILWLSWFGGTYLHLLCFLFLNAAPFEFLNFIWNDHKLETVSATSDFLGLGEPGYSMFLTEIVASDLNILESLFRFAKLHTDRNLSQVSIRTTNPEKS